jgi:hypothetical protein
MRIEHVISHYDNQSYNRQGRRPFTFKGQAHKSAGGVVVADCIHFSSDDTIRRDMAAWLFPLIHLISDEDCEEWIKTTFYRNATPDEALLEKLIVEIV